MHSDLQKLITLQHLDSAAAAAHKRLADEPDRLKALDARLDAARQAVATAKEQLAANQSARRELDKEVAAHQGRLSKFREQAMAVKTNQEYHAIQHEIAFAQTEIKKIEDSILERMMEGDELAAALKGAEAALVAEQKAVDAERKTGSAASVELKASLERIAGERATLVAGLDKGVLSTFEIVARKRNGIAVAEARSGVCTICHV